MCHNVKTNSGTNNSLEFLMLIPFRAHGYCNKIYTQHSNVVADLDLEYKYIYIAYCLFTLHVWCIICMHVCTYCRLSC